MCLFEFQKTERMFTFIVPVKSAKLASDWPAFSRLFERTLKSICNQKSQNFRVIVACHELPEVQYQNEKVEYLQVSFPPPTLVEDDWDKNRELKEGDKANKILAAHEKAMTYNPDFIMVVDADDLISNRIVSFTESQKKDTPGWYIKKGYYYREGAPYLFLNKKTFNNLCGSCIIIRPDLFPLLIIKEPWLYYYHELKEVGDGTELVPLPFAGALYSMANGENHFMSVQHAKKLINKPKIANGKFLLSLWHKFLKYRIRPLTGSFKKSFSFYQVQ